LLFFVLAWVVFVRDGVIYSQISVILVQKNIDSS